MLFKILMVLLIVATKLIFCSSTPLKSFDFIKVPKGVKVVNMTPSVDGLNARFFNEKGEQVFPDKSWYTKVHTSDERIIKHISGNCDTNNQGGINVKITNNNEHIITQNNFQKQQEWPIPPRRTIDYSKIPKNPGLLSLTATLIAENKVAVILGSIGISWAAVLSKLLYASYTIATQNGWSVWNGHLQNEALYNYDQTMLAQTLFNDIKKHYAQQKRQFLCPLIYFINDVDEEIKQLKQFLRIHEILKTIKMSVFFPKQKETQALAYYKIQRLEFLKNLVNNFATEYKISN